MENDYHYFLDDPETSRHVFPSTSGLPLQIIFVYIFLDKPSKPIIHGNLTIKEDSFLVLNCISQSQSAPEYYNKFVSVYYVWFVNDTKITNEYNRTLKRHVSRGDRNSQYSCIAKNDKVQSDMSDPVRINLLCKSQTY